jgi:GGDEF domain-containing protein
VLQVASAAAVAGLVAGASFGLGRAGVVGGSATAGVAVAAALGYVLLLFLVNNPFQRAREEELRRLERHGRRLAIYDRETGLYAHWYFTLRLEEEIARARRDGEGFALLLVESLRGRLDEDTERLLIERLRNGFRGTDLVAHIGNLRFVVLLASTDSVGANVVYQRMAREAMPCPVQIGLALFPDDGVDWRSLIEAAERTVQPSATAA